MQEFHDELHVFFLNQYKKKLPILKTSKRVSINLIGIHPIILPV
jgi:hypothetical protein